MSTLLNAGACRGQYRAVDVPDVGIMCLWRTQFAPGSGDPSSAVHARVLSSGELFKTARPLRVKRSYMQPHVNPCLGMNYFSHLLFGVLSPYSPLTPNSLSSHKSHTHAREREHAKHSISSRAEGPDTLEGSGRCGGGGRYKSLGEGQPCKDNGSKEPTKKGRRRETSKLTN